MEERKPIIQFTDEERQRYREKYRPRGIAELTDDELEQIKQETTQYLELAHLTGIYNMDRLKEIRKAVHE